MRCGLTSQLVVAKKHLPHMMSTKRMQNRALQRPCIADGTLLKTIPSCSCDGQRNGICAVLNETTGEPEHVPGQGGPPASKCGLPGAQPSVQHPLHPLSHRGPLLPLPAPACTASAPVQPSGRPVPGGRETWRQGKSALSASLPLAAPAGRRPLGPQLEAAQPP